MEDAPAPDALNKFDVMEKNDGVYIKAEESAIKGGRRIPNVKCQSQGEDKVVVVGGYVFFRAVNGSWSALDMVVPGKMDFEELASLLVPSMAGFPLTTHPCRGSGAFGAVQKLRELGFKGSITMISNEGYLPIDRTKLSKALIADASKIVLRPEDFYSSADISFVQDTATTVDFDKKSVSTKSGSQYPYTQLILATGGTPKNLPLPGFKELSNIFVLRHVQNVQDIMKAVGDKGKKIVIVGSSFIGMEVANALAKENTVSVIGMEKAPLERIMGEKVGQIFQRNLEKNGAKFYMGASVDSAIPSAKDKNVVGAVKLKDGTELEADLVILGIGVGPATEFLKENNAVKLEKDGSIETDEFFKVKGMEDVYALGDIATYPYHGPGGNGKLTRIEHWSKPHPLFVFL